MDSKALSPPHPISFKLVPVIPSSLFCEAVFTPISAGTCSMRKSLLENWQIFLSSDFLWIDITRASLFLWFFSIISPIYSKKKIKTDYGGRKYLSLVEINNLKKKKKLEMNRYYMLKYTQLMYIKKKKQKMNYEEI